MAPPLLSLRDITLTFGGAPLIDGAEFAVEPGMRACIVGRNGTGKSTLLKIAAGLVEADSGTRFVQPGTTIAYMEQEPNFDGFGTVADFVGAGTHADEHYKVAAILTDVNLSPDSDPRVFSGGEARRAALAKALLNDPDILLLDEPTNHLDLPTIEWLERTLSAFRGAVVTISHDRTFLGNITTRCFWLDRGVIRTLNKGYTFFDAWADDVLAQEELEQHKLSRQIERELHWLRRGVTARRKRNQGRLRNLNALRDAKRNHIRQTGQADLAIESGVQSGKLVVEAKSISKRFDTPDGPKQVVRDLSVRIQRGDRVGLIGPNGAGKSTLLKMLTGETLPDDGTVRLGTNLEPLYIDQNRNELDPDKTLWDMLCPKGGDQVMVRGKPKHVIGYLKDFLFDERQARQPVSALSGGERNRLLLAMGLAKPSNLLILDEPTNDLDMDTLDLLQDMLGDYEGTLLLVSHDRDFLDRIVTSTLAFEGNGKVIEYPGGYQDYLRLRTSGTDAGGPIETTRKTAADPAPKKTKIKTKLSYKEQRQLDMLGQRIPKLEALINRLETELSDSTLFADKPETFRLKADELESARADLEDCEQKWLEIELLKEELAGG